MAAADPFSASKANLSSPYTGGEAVTKHDTNELTKVTRALYVGGAGTLTVITSDGSTIAFGAVTAGTLLPLRVKIVKNTGTSATSITALW